jgi:hypothetical protein
VLLDFADGLGLRDAMKIGKHYLSEVVSWRSRLGVDREFVKPFMHDPVDVEADDAGHRLTKR